MSLAATRPQVSTPFPTSIRITYTFLTSINNVVWPERSRRVVKRTECRSISRRSWPLSAMVERVTYPWLRCIPAHQSPRALQSLYQTHMSSVSLGNHGAFTACSTRRMKLCECTVYGVAPDGAASLYSHPCPFTFSRRCRTAIDRGLMNIQAVVSAGGISAGASLRGIVRCSQQRRPCAINNRTGRLPSSVLLGLMHLFSMLWTSL